MSTKDKWTVETAAETITRKGGKISGGRIVCSSPGLKVLSAIDYLVNHHKLVWVKGEKKS